MPFDLMNSYPSISYWGERDNKQPRVENYDRHFAKMATGQDPHTLAIHSRDLNQS